MKLKFTLCIFNQTGHQQQQLPQPPQLQLPQQQQPPLQQLLQQQQPPQQQPPQLQAFQQVRRGQQVSTESRLLPRRIK